ncbi:MAG: ATP-binding cassette domain-containing protein [Desulfobacterales bacterium]|nr:ATP-binding cassette domain-containing protein [Desulfobacterales bacterium]
MLFDTIPKRKFLVPEVIQTSAMDCGPATLKAMLEGFDISASYGRLREACQTDVDGTSIDSIEDVAVQLGLEAQQTMLPLDNLLLPVSAALPAIVVTRLPNGFTHFVIVWSVHGSFVQIMDPGTGRRWLTKKNFLKDVYIHRQTVSVEDWHNWAKSDGFLKPLCVRMENLKIGGFIIDKLIETAKNGERWQTLAALDASVRMVDSIVNSGGFRKGSEASKALQQIFTNEITMQHDQESMVPINYWSIEPSPNENESDQVILKGAVTITVSGKKEIKDSKEISNEEQLKPLSPELVAALEEESVKPEKELIKAFLEDGWLVIGMLLSGLALATFAVTVEAILFRGLLEITSNFQLIGQRISAMGLLIAFLCAVVALSLPMESIKYRIGRRIETRLRIAFLEKIPRLGDKYFHSRLTSDMTHRAYELRQLRMYPNLAVMFIRVCFEILITTICIIWITPSSAHIAIIATLVVIGVSLMAQPLLNEQSLRLQTLIGAISRFYLDSLLGIVPIRTHRAELSVRREHEGLMVEWARAGISLYKADLLIIGIEALVGAFFTVWILYHFVSNYSDPKGILLLMYWTMKLPQLGKVLASLAQQYPMMRNMLLRLLEPLTSSEESTMYKEDKDDEPYDYTQIISEEGISLSLQDVNVQAGGQTILKEINLKINSNEHVAIVGPSGAGKSSFVGLFLGWHRPNEGKIFIDGKRLNGSMLNKIRSQISWVDPEVQLWNKTLIENLRYGSQDIETSNLSQVIELADLLNMLEKFPNGLQTVLGEGGGLVSGGEGQRVRLGRAMLRDKIRLVIMDEPFRGLDRSTRRELLKKARAFWKKSTLIFISHDVSETLLFDRVLVIENGQIAEDDTPKILSEKKDSRYSMLLKADEAVRNTLWASAEWRRLWLKDGKLDENANNND